MFVKILYVFPFCPKRQPFAAQKKSLRSSPPPPQRLQQKNKAQALLFNLSYKP